MYNSVKGTVLIVDDTEENIDVLMDALSGEFDLCVALDGESALELVEENRPSLILLDIMMPGMDGYEVCRRLKAGKMTKDIPIIFLTAMTDVEDEAKGLALGAIDYITKPFNSELVRARVRNHIALRMHQLELVRQKDALEDNYLKIKELEDYKDQLVHMIVHDLRSPLAGILAFLSLALMEKDNLSEEVADSLETCQFAAEELNEMVSSLLDVCKLEAGKMPVNREKCSLKEIIENAMKRMGGLLIDRDVNVVFNSEIPEAWCDPSLMERVVVNLLSNALKFTPLDGKIWIEADMEFNRHRITVRDTGFGIPKKYQSKIFEKFAQAEIRKDNKKFSTGLGLTFCKLAVEAHGGSIELISEEGQGTLFHVRLPELDTAEAISLFKEDTVTSDERKDDGVNVEMRKLKVVVADDDFQITRSLKRYLESWTDWKVVEANKGERLIRKAGTVQPDIFVIDVDMPEINGAEAAAEIESIMPAEDPFIIYLSGLIQPDKMNKDEVSRLNDKYPMVAKGLPLAEFLKLIIELYEQRKTK